jgi:hypothetical protein
MEIPVKIVAVLHGGFRTKGLTWALFVICLLVLAGPASAGIVFDNYPINGTINAWTINFGYWVSDSFTIAAPTVVTGANFGTWNLLGDDISAVDWAIGTAAFGSGSGSGTATVSDTLLGANLYGLNIYSNSIAFAGILLDPGIYYLTLQNAVVASGDPVFWDENDGGAVTAAYSHWAGDPPATTTPIGAESFQILGDVGTPEPGSLVLFGSGMLLLAGALRRKASR